MSYTQEVKIKLLVENILTTEYKNFSYGVSLSTNYLDVKTGTFDKNWEGKATFIIDPNKLMYPTQQINLTYSISYKNSNIATATVLLSSLIEVKLQNTRETIKGNWRTKDKIVPVFVKKQAISRKCQHTTDGAISIAQYIVDEIKQNVKSETAKKISEELNGYDLDDLLNFILISPVFSIVIDAVSPMGRWYAAVKSGAKWDHKPKVKNKFKAVAVHRPLEKGTPSESYYHKYKEHDYYYDVWSNIHYGYVGLSVGFSEWILNIGSSKAQGMDGGGSEDPIDDVTCINIGYTLYKRFGKYAEGLTAQHVLDELEKCTDKKLPESRKTHWCWSNDNPLKIAKK